MKVVFLFSTLFCVYTYGLFPLLLHWRVRRRAKCNEGASALKSSRSPDALPGVSIVIAVHNEAQNLPAKAASLAALDYPQNLLEIIFVSDGSTDNTPVLLENICQSRLNWKFSHYVDGAGKPTALNLGVEIASGDVIVFMDARQTVSSNAVTALVVRLMDPGIGVVSGELMLTDDAGGEAGNVGYYWRYEKWIRRNESELFSTTGATGALYAIRREDYKPLASDTLLDDFDTPISLLRQGKRSVFEPAARAYDRPEADVSGEFKRKARTLAGNFQSFARNAWVFDPRKNPVWWQFLSHKVFRLGVPYALILALLSSILGEGLFLKLMLLLQIVFYALGMLGLLGVKNPLVNIVNVFLQLNAAAVVGAYRAIRGGSAVRWKAT